MGDIDICVCAEGSVSQVKFSIPIDELVRLIHKAATLLVSKKSKEKTAKTLRQELLKIVPDRELADHLLKKLERLNYEGLDSIKGLHKAAFVTHDKKEGGKWKSSAYLHPGIATVRRGKTVKRNADKKRLNKKVVRRSSSKLTSRTGSKTTVRQGVKRSPKK